MTKWTEAALQRLIDDGEIETNALEYKAAPALDGSQGKKAEISKDVSAMANAAGGVVIYGIAEGSQGVPSHLDGIDPGVFSLEWLDSVIRSNIQPAINGLVIDVVPLSDGKVAYVVKVPQATTRAPHMAKDNRYHWRANATTAAMEDFQVRDVMRRATSPDLSVEFQLSATAQGNGDAVIGMNVVLTNTADTPAQFTTVTVGIEERFVASAIQGDQWIVSGGFPANFEARMKFFEANLSAPRDQPIYKGRPARLSQLIVPMQGQISVCAIAYRVTTPGFEAQRTGVLMWQKAYGRALIEWDTPSSESAIQ